MKDWHIYQNKDPPSFLMAQLIPLQTHLSNLRWLRWIPVFRSSVLFNGVNYQGDDCKSKKKAEQLVARVVILSCLDSESGNDIVDIINCKLSPLVELNKVHEINSVHKVTNVVIPNQKYKVDIINLKLRPLFLDLIKCQKKSTEFHKGHIMLLY
ncbi:hypothetical protein Tco_1212563 [Tanacetum coccineum]